MTQFISIFLLNLLTSIDNAVVIGGIANRYKNLFAIGVVSAAVITVCRTLLIIGIVSIVKWPGLRMTLGILVAIVAVSLANVDIDDRRGDSGFWKVLLMVVATDLALSVDNILSIAVLSKNPMVIASSVFLSLLPLLMLLPWIVKVMNQVPWLRILAAGFVAELAVDSITDDPIVKPHVPGGHVEMAVRIGFAVLVVLYGFWRTYWTGRRSQV